nr:A/G-specific adenine glycosylase [Acidomonas methanolica]
MARHALAPTRVIRHIEAVPSSAALLAWYDRHRRAMPWRAAPGHAASPYHVWLSEIMLQQTTVAAVRPYFTRFITRYPTVAALAQAPRDDVLALWAGLGYYSRARNLHACARQIADMGRFPQTVADLTRLPGIGPYTARAIAAIAFDQPVIPVDGNVERVTARVFNVQDPLPGARRILAQLAERLNEEREAKARPGDFAQALFDLGATICTPRNPACGLCPWREDCAGAKAGDPAALPRRAPKAARPQRFGTCFAILDRQDAIWLRRRPESGLLGGMTELPGTPWRDTGWTAEDAAAYCPFPGRFRELAMINHVFTHFSLQLTVMFGRVARFDARQEGFSCALSMIGAQALPSVMRKTIGPVLAALQQESSP